MKTIIIDTNFLVYCAKFKIDLFSELERICQFQYKIAILDSSIKEVNKIKPQNLALIKKYIEKFEVINSNMRKVDDELVSLSSNAIVATQDQELKRRLQGPVIIIRQKKYLELKNL